MSEREFLTAAFVALSKIQQVKSTPQPDAESMADLEKAFSALSAFSAGEERLLIDGWRAELEGLRKEAQTIMTEIQGRTRSLSDLAEAEIVARVISRIPDGEYRMKVEEELRSLLSGGEAFEIEGIGGGERPASSDLERKLELVESESSDTGLEKFMSTSRRGEPSD